MVTFKQRKKGIQSKGQNVYPSILIGQLFPNPPLEDGKVFIALVGDLEEVVCIEVRSQAGKTVHSTVQQMEGGGNASLDFSGLQPGQYEVKISCGAYTELRPLTIAKPIKKWTWKNLLLWFS